MPISFVLQVQGAEQAKAQIQSAGGAFQNFGKSAQTAAAAAEPIQRNYQQAALGLSAAAASATALFFQFDNLEKAQQRIEKSQSTLLSTEASLAAAQVTLTNMVKRGITEGAAYESAQLRIASSQERLRVATKDVELAQGDLQEANLQFALSVVPTVIGAVSSASLATKGLGLSFRTVGAVGAPIFSRGMGQAALSTKLLQLAMGPIGIAILGISTVMTLFATNAFGMRDAINAAGKAIGDAVPILRPLLDGLASLANMIFPEATESASDYEIEMEKAGAATADLQQATVIAAEEVKTFDGYLKDLGKSTADQRQENEFYLKSIGAITDAAKFTNEQLELMANHLEEQERAAVSAKQANFDLVASQMGVTEAARLSEEQLKRNADAIREYEEQTQKATQAVHNLRSAEESRSGSSSSESEGGLGFGHLGRSAAEARAKFGPGVNLVRKGGRWVPGDIVEFNNARSRLDKLQRRLGPEHEQVIAQREKVGALQARVNEIRLQVNLDGREIAQIVSRHQAEGI